MALLEELKRRNVYRVGIAYLAASWIALQLADVVLENLDVPGWVFRALLVIIVIGFPIALGLAWAFELTADGLRRDTAEPAPGGGASSGQYVQLAIIAVLAVAVGFLVVDKLNGGEAGAPAAVAVERSVAVLPFANRSANPDDAFFVDGMHDDILTQLARLETMEKVISQRTAEAYRETTKPMRQIADELGVATVLTGGFQRAGDNVRINMRLIDARNDETLWANSWDRELTLENLFAIQTEITEDVVAALQGSLTEGDRDQLGGTQTVVQEAYLEFRVGKVEMARRTAPALRRALVHFERAVELDPDYALAWVGIADAYALRTEYDDYAMEASFEPRRRAIDRALALDADSGEALTALAELRNDQGDKEASERFYRQAIAQSPNYPTARHWYSLLLRELGQLDEAIRQMAKARDIDPGAAILNVAEASLLAEAGRFDEADATVLDGIRRNPDFASLYGTRAMLQYNQGRIAEARRWVDEAARLSPTSPDHRETQCFFTAELGDLDGAEACVAALSRDFPTQFLAGASSVDLSINIQRGRIERFLMPVDQLAMLPEGARLGMGMAYFLADDAANARAIIAADRPELFESPAPSVGPFDVTLGFVVVSLLEDAGELDKALALLEEVERTAASVPGRTTVAEYADTMTALARDDDASAAEALRAALAIGDIQNWWVFRAPVFASALGGSEFSQAYAELEAEIARQRADYEAQPDLPPI